MKTPRSTPLAMLLLALLWSARPCYAQAPKPQLDLPRTKITAGMRQIDVQIASTPEQRQIGLMFRQSMAAHEGMLFIFQTNAKQCFWMRNTSLTLTAAFIADDGTIVNTADMQPQSDAAHCSAKPVRYVLEVNQGWFKKAGIQVGYQLKSELFPPSQKN